MSIKTKFYHILLWVFAGIIGLFALAIVVIPPMIDLNSLKPKIESIIFNETGVKAQIHGNINFSLMGNPTIVAHNISIPNGVISSCEFRIPLRDIFDIQNANINSDIIINGASFVADKILPYKNHANLIINDSKLQFLNKEYSILHATFSYNSVFAIVRTDQHKYEINLKGNEFTIKNKNNNLDLSGILFDNGTARGNISITAQNINRWFEFEKPKIEGTFPITAKINWNGNYGVNFDDISAKGITGRIALQEDGHKIINLSSKSADIDMGFVLTDTTILQDSSFNIDFSGKIKFLDKTFNHLSVSTEGKIDKILVHHVIADDLVIYDGYIDALGAHNLHISMKENGKDAGCGVFTGTPDHWSCKNFYYDDTFFGDIIVTNNHFVINTKSNKPIPDINMVINSAKRISNSGIINFNFIDTLGTITINPKNISIKYDYANHKTLRWAKINLPFLPEFMKDEIGNIIWQEDTIVFVPDSKTWYLTMDNNRFMLSGDSYKKWLSDLDLTPLQDWPYKISGNYKNGNISNLEIEMAKQKFTGSATGNFITLKTNILNIDNFISKTFIDNYEELSFFTVSPITIPFGINIELSLSANAIIYDGEKYDNFVYSLKQNKQTFSISDSDKGNLLAVLKKENLNYNIDIQLNKFVFKDKLLPSNLPLNIADTSVTAEMHLKTNGKIAHDVVNNLHGTFDISFDGGILYGIGTNEFYASAQNIKTLDAEYALAKALETGETPIKKMRIIGDYEQGNITTTSPLTLSLKHVDVLGTMEIVNNNMLANLKLVLRGTAPSPQPIDLKIYPDNHREFSLSEIMLNFDPEYMRAFTKTHNQF